MKSTMLVFAISLVISVLLVNAEDGRYHAGKYNQNAVFNHFYNIGRYMPMNDRAYRHIWDQRELGRYRHIPNPYIHIHIPPLPYDHIDIPADPYVHDGDDYEHVSSSSEYHPFNAQGYEIPKPEIPLVYGFPLQSSPESHPESSLPTEITPNDLTTTTDGAINEFDSTTILSGPLNRKKRSLFHSQPKTIEIRPTTTARPRTRYDDEGKWRIIRQEENKEQKKYDYFFETENKIFAQEAGKVSGKEKSQEGTSGVGWYQYIGDDGKVYRVEYEAGEQGFVPKGDHIHKAIQKQLANLKERNLI